MIPRFALLASSVLLASAMLAPSAFAAKSPDPVELGPGESVVSHTSTSENDSQYVVDLLSAIKSVKIGTDKTTVLITSNGKTNPIEIDYSDALGGAKSANAAETAANTDGDAAAAGPATGGGTIGLGQIAGLLLGLTILSRLIAIARQLGAGRR